MARIEKTVFISYRRADVYTALAVYENLKNHGYDVFFDYRSISSGDFEQIITSNIRARAHFVLILTPTALDRCNEPDDWLRREIEIAIDEKRNIVPLFFKGFRFGTPSVVEKLTGSLKNLSRYNGLNVHEDFFEEAMYRLQVQYLNIPLNTVLHPVSTEVRKVVQEEQLAADKALEQIEDVQKLVKDAEQTKLNPRLIAGIAGGLLLITLFAWGSMSFLNNLRTAAPEPTATLQFIATRTVRTETTISPSFPSETPIPPTPTLGIGTPMKGQDGMTLLYVPAGEFIMGSDTGESDEQPSHKITLDPFWIDQTEVTNAMYGACERANQCNLPRSTRSYSRPEYFGNAGFDNYPVIYVTWDDAKAYCEWVDRRLPTEAEWEKAARGENAFTYPWGNVSPKNNLLNYIREVGDTTEVGTYQDGKSPYGALDMAGNVWEWVSSLYQPYPYDVNNGREDISSSESRVLRGGAWDNDAYTVRSAQRGKGGLTAVGNYLGFRCAMSASP